MERCDQGEYMEIHVLRNSIEPVWEQGMFLGISQVIAETRQVIFGEREMKSTHSNLCCLPPHQSHGESGCADDGAA